LGCNGFSILSINRKGGKGMKKYLVLIGAAVLIVALAVPSFAQDWPKGFKSWGSMQFWTNWVNKRDFNNGGTVATTDDDKNLNQKLVSQRYNLFFQYGDEKTVKAVIGFEADSTVWGEAYNSSAVASPNAEGNLGSSGTLLGTGSYVTNQYIANGGKMGVSNTDQVALECKWAYLDFVIPNTPVMVTAGLRNVAIGGRLFQSQDVPGVDITTNFAPHKFIAHWWRRQDKNINTYSVDDYYSLEYQLTQKLWNLYAHGTYHNDLATGSAATNPYKDNRWWLGVGGGFRPGNFDLSGQFIYNGGKIKFDSPLDDTDAEAWVAELLAKYNIGPGLQVLLEGFYATGNDANQPNKSKAYVNPTGSESYSSFGTDRTVFYFSNWGDLGYQNYKNYNPAGMWYVRPAIRYSPTKWVSMILNYLYIGDTSSGSAGTFYQKVTGTTVTKTINSGVGARQDTDKNYIGSELNLITTFNIYQNFQYIIGVGIFLPGDVYDQPNKDADSAWGLNTKLIYAF